MKYNINCVYFILRECASYISRNRIQITLQLRHKNTIPILWSHVFTVLKLCFAETVVFLSLCHSYLSTSLKTFLVINIDRRNNKPKFKYCEHYIKWIFLLKNSIKFYANKSFEMVFFFLQFAIWEYVPKVLKFRFVMIKLQTRKYFCSIRYWTICIIQSSSVHITITVRR